VVDTHVIRLRKRLGLTKPERPGGKIERDLMELVPKTIIGPFGTSLADLHAPTPLFARVNQTARTCEVFAASLPEAVNFSETGVRRATNQTLLTRELQPQSVRALAWRDSCNFRTRSAFCRSSLNCAFQPRQFLRRERSSRVDQLISRFLPTREMDLIEF